VDNADTRLAVGTPAICDSLWRPDAAMNFAVYTKCVIGSQLPTNHDHAGGRNRSIREYHSDQPSSKCFRPLLGVPCRKKWNAL